MKRTVKGGGYGKMTHLPEALMLAHMMSKMNKNAKQRKAIIDSLNASQMRDVGHLVRGVLNVRRKLPKKQINQLIRDRKFIDAIVRGKGVLSMQKKIYRTRGVVFLEFSSLSQHNSQLRLLDSWGNCSNE